MMYCGIDPGLFGALAGVDEEGTFLFVHDTPVIMLSKNGRVRHEYDWPKLWFLLKPISEDALSMLVTIEEVHTMPRQGVVSQGRLLYGLGLWHGLLIAKGCRVMRPSPQTWKRVMLSDLGDKGKEASRMRACQLFPDAAPMLNRVKDHGRAEALLLAEYGRRTWKGDT